MKLGKAIEILETPGIPWSGKPLDDHYKARQLGIEALKKIERLRKVEGWAGHSCLPGETED